MTPYYTLNFSESQLSAIREIYFKYFHKYMPSEYTGNATVVFWDRPTRYLEDTRNTLYHNTTIFSKECDSDPLWENFADLLPYMKKSAVITKMPANSIMPKHIDRYWRPTPIYFPIQNCGTHAISKYYDSSNNIIYSYSIADAAVVTDVTKPHSVSNTSNSERIAFGWNSLNYKIPYEDFVKILYNLNYLK